MKKGEFYVFCVNNDGKKEVQTRRGYIDEEHNIAYSHIGKLLKDGKLVEFDLGFWNATDLVSGMIMAKGNTRKECIENAIKNMKYEIASELGVNLGPDATARQNGSVGGEITRRLVSMAQSNLQGK